MEDIAKQFLEKKYGWITPYGSFLVCRGYEHKKIMIDFLFKDTSDLGKNFREWYNSEQQKLEEIDAACIESANDDEPPEWHIYEMAQDDFEKNILTFAYNNHFIRLGTLNHTTIYAEGTAEGIQRNITKLIDIVGVLTNITGKDFDYRVEKIKANKIGRWWTMQDYNED